jgi:hypothetical protein
MLKRSEYIVVYTKLPDLIPDMSHIYYVKSITLFEDMQYIYIYFLFTAGNSRRDYGL